MTVSSLHRMGYASFGNLAKKRKDLPEIQSNLIKARMNIRAELFVSYAYACGVIGAIFVTLLGAGALTYAVLVEGLPPLLFVVLAILPAIGWYLGLAAILGDPASKAKKRGKEIDRKLGYATNYIAALSSAGVTPALIFKSLAKQPIYGAVKDEAAFIFKDMEVHGLDILTAMRRAMDRTPSNKFQDLMQGALTTIGSGGDLTTYFKGRSRTLQFEQRIEQKNFIETMGLMAEAYVTAAVAGPLFLLVMVSIFVLMGGGSTNTMRMIIFFLIPVLNIGFVFGLKAMTPEE